MYLVFGIIFLVVLSLLANLVAQRVLPTRERDDEGRQFGYRILVQFIGYGGFLSVAGLFYINRDTLLGWSQDDIAIAILITTYVILVVGGMIYQLWSARPQRRQKPPPEPPQPPLPSFVRKTRPRPPTTGA